MTTRNEWLRVARPEPAGVGQRFFRRDGESATYVCDNSGPNPDRSDDGPLRLITTEPIEVVVRQHSGIGAIVRVHCERSNTDASVLLSVKEAAWCAHELGMRVELSDDCRALCEVFTTLLEAGR